MQEQGRRRFPRTALAALAVACALWCAPARGQTGTELAKAWLTQALQNPRQSAAMMLAFRSIADKDLMPLLTALSKSGDKTTRLRATEALGQNDKSLAFAPLADRLNKDPVMAIRAQALAQLLTMDLLTADQLKRVLTMIPDEGVQGMVSRALIKKGQGAAVVPALRKLAKSVDTSSAALAKMSLVGLGDSAYLAELRKLVLNPKTPALLVELLMQQIVEEKITAAQSLAMQIAETGQSGPVRMLGYKALAGVNPNAAQTLYNAFQAAKGDVLRVHLVHALASTKNSQPFIKAATADAGIAGVMARFELARIAGGAPAAEAARKAIALGHPVVIEYIVDRAKEDLATGKNRADFYAPALLDIIRALDPAPGAMGREHVMAAQAATLITRMNAPAEIAEMKKLLAGRRTAQQKVIAAGLRWSKSPVVCDLALVLLKNPYEDAYNDGAMTLGYFGRKEAVEPLKTIVRHANRHAPEQVALACWYLLKIEGTQARVVAELARVVQAG